MSFTTGGSRWPDVWLAATARGISSCGDFLAATALTLALQSAGGGGLAVSGLLLAATLPLVALAPLTGRLADRVDSRTLLIVAGLAQSAICAALAYATAPALVLTLVALLATGLAVTQPVLAALVPVMVRAEDLPRAGALNQTAGTLGALAGPALAGLLVGQFGTRVPLLVDAVSYLALVVAALLIRTRRGRRATAAAGVAAPTPAWRLRRDPMLLVMVGSVAAVVGAVGAINVIEVFFIRETLNSSTTVYGLVTGAWTAGIVLGAWLFARVARRLADDGALLGAGLLLLGGCCLAVLVSAAVPSAWLLVPIWLVGGTANGGDNVFNNLLLARRVPEAARGRAFAVFGAAVQGAAMGGYLVGGLLLAVADPRPLVVGCGVVGLLVVAALAGPVRRAARAERAAVGDGPLPGLPAGRGGDDGDTVGSWPTASPAPGWGTSSSSTASRSTGG
ncbi:MFS transporter [Micromonospora sp. RP3T]|uniref:MFS transporter n=1 Tax=Micromonospora sp. RP3T TaxID=2135446 RepID=UPI000D16C6BD|nr:MFS transporter [Micromonospora sp. RP3T]PTA48044.1 MFS transporter [Micromonospora sp. RP3T]